MVSSTNVDVDLLGMSEACCICLQHLETVRTAIAKCKWMLSFLIINRAGVMSSSCFCVFKQVCF